jgi:hypothetical protein
MFNSTQEQFRRQSYALSRTATINLTTTSARLPTTSGRWLTKLILSGYYGKARALLLHRVDPTPNPSLQRTAELKRRFCDGGKPVTSSALNPESGTHATNSSRRRFAWHSAVALLAALPLVGALVARASLISSFAEMAEHHGGPNKTASAIHQANIPVVGSLLAGAAVALIVYLAVRSRPGLAAQLPGTSVPALLAVLACLPLLPLWLAETFMAAVVAQQVSGGIFEAKLDIDKLLLAVLILSIAAILVLLFSTLRSAKRANGSAATIIWPATATVLVATAALFWWHAASLGRAISAHLS